MAEKRMFAKHIIDSDMFLDLSATAQNLYFHLAMRADDDGFIDSVKKIMRMVNASQSDVELLVNKSFLIPFENGVCVIKHWCIHNTLRKDRRKETIYKKERRMICLDENKAYKKQDVVYNASRISATDDYTDTCETEAKEKEIKKNSVKEIIVVKNKKNDKVLQMINDLVISEELKNAYLDYYEHRKQIKKKLTLLAFERILKKFENWNYDDDLTIQSINTSIENGWAGLFEVQHSQVKNQKIGTGNLFFDMIEQDNKKIVDMEE